MIVRDALRAACLDRPGVTVGFPFGPDAEVYKVLGKMFALVPVEDPLRITLKGEPGWNDALRRTYQDVEPGYYMNKQHWNTVRANGDVPDDELFEMIDASYDLVVTGLTRRQQAELRAQGGDAPG